MFPNPQDALPLPVHPDAAQYRKLAKDRVKACASGEIRRWTDRWIDALQRVATAPDDWKRRYQQVEEFAARTMAEGERRCALSDAHFVIARAHGFESWPEFAAHLDALSHPEQEAAFEAAVDAIVTGDEAALRELLRENPGLVHARSTREHHGTLLHYVAANGVEGYRQVTPKNIIRIAEILLDAGAEVDAGMEVYGSGCSTLGLVATSSPPHAAGVQLPLIQLLLDRGADVNKPGIAGGAHRHEPIVAFLANGQGEAAVYLAARGARIDLVGAAGLGRLDVVKASFDEAGQPRPGVTREQLEEALLYACGWERNDVVEYLLDRGVDPNAHDDMDLATLHWAVMGGQLDTIRLLLRRGANLEFVSKYGGTPLGQALWSAGHGKRPDEMIPVIEALIAAGARLPERHVPISPSINALLATHGSVADPTQYWYGEEPRGTA